MDLKYLDNFLALAQYQSFSAAAEACYISQSSFSKRIMHLEQELGVTLFERTTRQVNLTAYGEIYLKYALKINTLSQQATDEINRRHAEDERLVIGGIPSINEYGILDLITGFIAKTHIRCQVKTAPSEELEQMLAAQTIDFAFIKDVQNTTDLTQVPYMEDHLVAVLPRQHPLAQQTSIQIKQLAQEDFIFQPVHSRPYDLCVKLCQENGFTPNVIYADRIVENILNFVKKGLGVSLLMEKLVVDDELVVLPITPTIVADINLCYTQKQTLNHFQQQFMTYFNQKNQH
ncbi:LysR family transcriptional regulator [Lactiplantibacillus mudanjiangensis]|uniref:Transcription regulator [Lactobacillus plantarum JDM1] n=1 Tax=Lactiplantibacillus mudanjiangensis TaxID=1296538 RepID=A0A660DU93_9LACO|nr:LysR family transcriptional regulator [Lactiplantibacillus mudanjiangensis]VDG22433.1 transcription regulator [Lactobacillus plantarum JDM1] [Lactiplantibacillus mudanjiangensis]VDG27032.1 transcription regulator [Lactobacillus plantarum JDM1] [Lactiplantibacillus mudanjiangensis]VDG32129.1 transcription regulator [Lactobacillus plantarum JDM1] [Lactiplantibacillus mudanjiangensis]